MDASYPTSKVRSSSHEEITHVQGKRNPSKTACAERGHQRADRLKNHNHRQLANLITWATDLSNSMKLSHAMWGHPRRVGIVERSDRMWSTGKGNGKPLQYSSLENPMNSMKRQNDRILKEEFPRSVGAQHATGDERRNNFQKERRYGARAKTIPSCGCDW